MEFPQARQLAERDRNQFAPIWRLKVQLLEVAPVVWRRFDTHADVTLLQLHHIIQGAMGWDLAHLYAFEDGRGCGGQFSNFLRLCDVCQVGDALIYAYDFGDNWRHLVSVEKAVARPVGDYPRVIAGNRACPPEDCGGSRAYRELLSVLAGPHNARKRELVEWVGRSFDPNAFNLKEAQARLVEFAALVAPKPMI